MTKKHVRNIALVIVVMFAITIVVYPLIFGTDPHPKKEPIVELEIHK